MHISHETPFANGTTSSLADAPGSSAAHADIGFFNAHMANPASGVSPTGGSSALSERSNQLHVLSSRVTQGMRDMSMNKNSRQAREITKALSEAHQQLAVTVKVVNKSVQMVEKLTNLQ